METNFNLNSKVINRLLVKSARLTSSNERCIVLISKSGRAMVKKIKVDDLKLKNGGIYYKSYKRINSKYPIFY